MRIAFTAFVVAAGLLTGEWAGGQLACAQPVGLNTWNRQGDEETATLSRNTLQRESHNPNEDEQKQLRVEWGSATLNESGMLAVKGRLFLESADGQSKKPISWVQGVRVILARAPDEHPDWHKRHGDKDSVWDNCITEKDASFQALFFVDRIRRPVGKTGSFQVAVSLGTKVGQTITWKNSVPVLPQTVDALEITGPALLSPTQRLINAVPSVNQLEFNPVPLIRAVNHLHGLGKEKAIAALRDFLTIAGDHPFAQRDPENIDTSDRQCVFLIVRLLFQPATQGEVLPQIKIGAMSPRPDPMEEEQWPLYPLVLQDDIPFLIMSGVLLRGSAQRPEEHVDWAEKHGKLRNKPLCPADNPFQAVATLWSQPKAVKLFGGSDSKRPSEYCRTYLRMQGWRMVRELVGHKQPLFQEENGVRYDVDADWEELRRAASEIKIYWDEKKQGYFAKEPGRLQ
jgi:hypothetical protein